MSQTIGVGVSSLAARRVATQVRSDTATRPRHFLSTAVMILLAGLWLRLWNLGGASLWTDEVMTAFRAGSSLQQAFRSILSAGNQMPLYFIALRAMPNTSDMLLRLPSAICGLLGIALIMFAAVRLYSRYDLALWSGALLAFNPYHILLSRTARYYSLIFVLALIVSYCYLMLLRGHRTRRIWIIFTLGSMLAYLTHYTTLALPAAQLVVIALTLRHDRPLIRRWIGAQIVAVIPVLVWLVVLSHHPPDVGPQWVPVPALKDLLLTVWAMTTGYTGPPRWYVVPGRMAVSTGLAFALIAAVRGWRMQRDNLYWAILIVAPLLVTFTISALLVSFYVDRYFMVFLPALLLLIPQGLERGSRRFQTVALMTILLAGTINIIATFHNGSYERDDFRSAAGYVAAHSQPGDGVLVERPNIEQAFLLYYGNDAPPPLIRLDSTPDTTPFEQESARIWVIYRNPNEDVHRQGVMPAFDPFAPGITPLGDWLHVRQNQVIAEKSFNGVTVILLDSEGEALAAEP